MNVFRIVFHRVDYPLSGKRARTRTAASADTLASRFPSLRGGTDDPRRSLKTLSSVFPSASRSETIARSSSTSSSFPRSTIHRRKKSRSPCIREPFMASRKLCRGHSRGIRHRRGYLRLHAARPTQLEDQRQYQILRRADFPVRFRQQPDGRRTRSGAFTAHFGFSF